MSFQGPGRWFTFAGTGEEVTLDLCESDYDTALGVYTGSCGELVCVGGHDDGGCDTRSSYTFISEAEETYYVFVGGYNAREGSFALSLNCAPVCPQPTYARDRLPRPYFRTDHPAGATFRFAYPNVESDSVPRWLLDGDLMTNSSTTSVDPAGALTHTFQQEGMYELCFSEPDANGCPVYHCEDYFITFEDRTSPEFHFSLSEDLAGLEGELTTRGADKVYWYSTEGENIRHDGTGTNVVVPFAQAGATDCQQRTLFASYQVDGAHWETKMITAYACEPDDCNTRINAAAGGGSDMVCTSTIPLSNISWVVDGVQQLGNVDSIGTLTALIEPGTTAKVCLTGYNERTDRYRSCCQTIERTNSTNPLLLERARTVYPNPATTSFSLLSGPGGAHPSRVQLFDLGGRLLRNWSRNDRETYDLTGLPGGMYVLRLYGDGTTQVERLVIEQ
jgi:hypothetical protein